MEELQDTIIDVAHLHICLNCPKAECNNCFSKASSTGRDRKAWTEQELKLLQETSLSNQEIAKLIGRSRASVADRRRRDGITMYSSRQNDYHKLWTKEADEYLLTHTNGETAEHLGITRSNCAIRRYRLSKER